MASETSFIPPELNRIATFISYPDGGDTPSVLTLARAGFVYAGREFVVTCPMCGIEIEKFRRGENPLEEHSKRSPSCPLAAQASNSISLPTIDVTSKDAKWSSPAMLELYGSVVRRFSGGRIETVKPLANASATRSSLVGVDRENPDYELLRCERYRLDTFHDWPTTSSAVPEELAREGLFYTGSGDRVRCAFCRNALHGWESGDIPREEHQRYFPECPFFQICNDVAIENGSSLENFSQDPLEISTSLPVYSVDIFMTTPAVRAVLELGYSAQVVRQTAQQQLDETGELFPNAETLLEKLLSLEVQICPILPSVESSEARIPETAAPVASPKQPETTTHCATTSSEQMTSYNATIDPIGQENREVAKKRKIRRKKNGGSSSNSGSTVSLGSTRTSSTTSQANNTTTSTTTTTTTTTANASEAANFLEEGENSGMLLDSEEQELMEENTRLKDARTCKVCLDREVNTVFLPCGHLICCEVCSPRVQNCPLCRTFIRGTVKTYLS